MIIGVDIRGYNHMHDAEFIMSIIVVIMLDDNDWNWTKLLPKCEVNCWWHIDDIGWCLRPNTWLLIIVENVLMLSTCIFVPWVEFNFGFVANFVNDTWKCFMKISGLNALCWYLQLLILESMNCCVIWYKNWCIRLDMMLRINVVRLLENHVSCQFLTCKRCVILC